ncbi:hypothetical protein [Poseidonocella sp. HB161398]|uniref:hypothetical protein n=1 Tax=Poseidonocella sp. HB161398 TaxID=2320855 RepID=UPI001108E357|nr:hypothetical protein [Poseidonocella sp. HB161398]
MAITKLHELHGRRFGRNLGVGLCLAAFVALVFGLTLAKVSGGGGTQAFDHVVRPELAQEGQGG